MQHPGCFGQLILNWICSKTIQRTVRLHYKSRNACLFNAVFYHWTYFGTICHLCQECGLHCLQTSFLSPWDVGGQLSLDLGVWLFFLRLWSGFVVSPHTKVWALLPALDAAQLSFVCFYPVGFCLRVLLGLKCAVIWCLEKILFQAQAHMEGCCFCVYVFIFLTIWSHCVRSKHLSWVVKLKIHILLHKLNF